MSAAFDEMNGTDGLTRPAYQELADWLANLDGQTDCWEGELSIGKVTPVRARVLVQRCPPEVAARRRQKLHDRARRNAQSDDTSRHRCRY